MLDNVLQFADNALILGHRNSEWTGHGPILEQDIALSNISLDLIGQARNFYQYAAELLNDGSTEDSLAYTRTAEQYRNCMMAEQENGDWGKTILRQFLFSAYQYQLYQQNFNDGRMNAICAKSLKEVTYHLRWSSEWVIRLGRGTAESGRRMNAAIQELWQFTDEMVPDHLWNNWMKNVSEILGKAQIDIPANVQMQLNGRPTPVLEALLNEMQFMQRTYPGMQW